MSNDFKTYEEARRFAGELARRVNGDAGIERMSGQLSAGKPWIVRLLPAPKWRQGHELRCEVVTASDPLFAPLAPAAPAEAAPLEEVEAAPDPVRSCITGKGVHLSATIAQTYVSCPRIVWYERIAGRPREETPAMRFGTELHALAERWLRVGDKALDALEWSSRAGAVFRAGKQLLPPPGTTHIEGMVAGNCGPLPFTGRVDFRPNGPNNYHPQVPSGIWIGDHKTTSDLQYALGPDGLARNVQILTYAWATWGPDGLDAGLPEHEKIGFVHVYYVTKGRPNALRVDAVTTWGDVVDNWLGTMLPIAIALAKLAKVADPRDVPANSGACRNYGRLCAHAEVCPSSPLAPGNDTFSLIFK